jgi:hypothetical protein
MLSTVARLWAERLGFDSQPGHGVFSHQCIKTSWGATQFPMQLVLGSFPGGKQLRHEADHSPPSSAKIKKKNWSYRFNMCLHGVVPA